MLVNTRGTLSVARSKAAKKEIEVFRGQLEESDTYKQKQKRENEELRAQVEKYQSDVVRLDKARKKIQGELDDVTVSMERERNTSAQMSHKQKKFDQMLSEEKANSAALALERDNAEKLARQNETKVLSLQNANDELEDKLTEVTLFCIKMLPYLSTRNYTTCLIKPHL